MVATSMTTKGCHDVNQQVLTKITFSCDDDCILKRKKVLIYEKNGSEYVV